MYSILLIEDSLENTILVERVLQAHGYQMLHASTGERGIQLAIEEGPDMVLIDIGLPDVDGHTVVTLLRQVEELQGVPMVAITAWPADIAQEMCERYNYDGVIIKPISVRNFPKQIERYLSAVS
ncbi:MAG: response regulator [Candidatus Promineifilaceae bacterium]|nr:response regulator [Candidatus Promineifilaceae bacterium]